ncbi:MAG: cytochrome b [Gammaproteobacteria bacterium]|nr:cytochrome b [Gammaproteobacteria bacterium]
MQWRNSANRYGLLTKLLHWLTATLIIGLIWLGWYMVDLSYFDRWYTDALAWHRVLGLVVFGLGVATLGWRLVSPSPAPVATLKPWERVLGTAMHHLLFVMVFTIPLTGYLVSTSAGKSVSVFGWFDVPPLFEVDSGLRDAAIEAHFYLAYTTAVLVAMHAGAALKHQLLDRDGTLARMLWK